MNSCHHSCAVMGDTVVPWHGVQLNLVQVLCTANRFVNKKQTGRHRGCSSSYSGVVGQIQSARSHYALRYDGHSLSLPHDMSRTLYRLKGAKGAFRPPHESSTLREPGTKGCRTYPAVVILPQAATTTPSPELRLGARACSVPREP